MFTRRFVPVHTILMTFAFTFLSISGLQAAGTGKIAGTVIDGATGEPLPGVNILVEGTNLGAAADENGEYYILNVSPGVYDVRAQAIGYSEVLRTGVRVSIDLTTTVNFETQIQAVTGEEVIVVADRPIVVPDISGSQRNIGAEEILDGGFHSMNNLLTTQVGVSQVSSYEDNPGIRGSSLGESLFIVDGISQMDPMRNRPVYQVSMDAIKEVKMQTGGFSARYGNLRSAVVSVVTKEGGDTFSGSLNLRYSPPGLKHKGPMMYGFDSPVVQQFIDPFAGAFDGKNKYALDKDGNPTDNIFFPGWNAYAASLAEEHPHYNKPDEAYARYLWRHRSSDAIKELQALDKAGRVAIEWGEGVTDPGDLVHHEYGVLPDYNITATLGGPVPVLPRTTFFASYNQEQIEYSSRPIVPAYTNKQGRVKVTSRLSDVLKLQYIGVFSRELGHAGGNSDFGEYINSNPFQVLNSRNKLWYSHCGIPMEMQRQTHGLALTHVLSPSTFYELRVNHSSTTYDLVMDLRKTATMPNTVVTDPDAVDYNILKNGLTSAGGSAGTGVIDGMIGTDEYAAQQVADGVESWDNWKDWAQIKIGNVWYDESPAGYGPVNWRDLTGYYRMESCNLKIDDAYNRSTELQGSLTSQLNFNNQIETGFNVQYIQNQMFQENRDPSVNSATTELAQANTILGGIYVSDKLEYKGFIANVGVRSDFIQYGNVPAFVPDLNNPDDPLWTDENGGPYTDLLLAGNTINLDADGNPLITAHPYDRYNIYDAMTLRKVRHFNVSPRLGISHPITTVAKIYFNYGHMYQWPAAWEAYRVRYDKTNRIDRIGNPSLLPPKTISYELGYEHNLFNKMSLSITGYYKDVTNESREARFYPLGKSNIRTRTNQQYKDVRGLETRLALRKGVLPYISGWTSLDLQLTSTGRFGFERYYEDPTRQPREVSRQVSSPDLRPKFMLNMNFYTPGDWGALLGGTLLNLRYVYRRGNSFTWNPKDLPLVERNVRWKGYQRVDLHLSKDVFGFGSIYLDITNLLNRGNMTHNSGSDISTSQNWAWEGHDWWSDELREYMFSLGYTAENQSQDRHGTFDKAVALPGTGELVTWKDGKVTDPNAEKYGAEIKAATDGAYNTIKMPGFTTWTFLESRDIYIGIRFNF